MLARDCDILVHDSTFTDLHDDLARETLHSTSREAAQVACDSGAKQLILWHISSRIDEKGEADLVSQAMDAFPTTQLPTDLDEYDVLRP